MHKEELRELWYPRGDLVRFRQHTLDTARRLIRAARQSSAHGQDNCVQALARLYQDFCDENNDCINDNSPPGCDLATYAARHEICATAFSHGAVLAMEKWVVRSAGADRLARRRHLYRVACRRDDDNTCPDTLRVQCQAISKPVRLWAHHVALMVAAQGPDGI